MEVRNLLTITDEDFFRQSLQSAESFLLSGNTVLTRYWFGHAASFVTTRIADCVSDAMIAGIRSAEAEIYALN